VSPTGENHGVGFGWGAYRNKFGGIEMKGTSTRCHSLTLENCQYLDQIAKGHKSAAVNSAIQWYRGQGIEIHELLANIEGLQNVIRDLHDSQEDQGKFELKNSVSSRGGIWARLARMWPF